MIPAIAIKNLFQGGRVMTVQDSGRSGVTAIQQIHGSNRDSVLKNPLLFNIMLFNI